MMPGQREDEHEPHDAIAGETLPILGDWPYDEEMVGLGFFPDEVSLRHDHPTRRE
jgi:hypothetical protein